MTKMHTRSNEDIFQCAIHKIRTARAMGVNLDQARRQIATFSVNHARAVCLFGIERGDFAVLHQQATLLHTLR